MQAEWDHSPVLLCVRCSPGVGALLPGSVWRRSLENLWLPTTALLSADVFLKGLFASLLFVKAHAALFLLSMVAAHVQ